MLILFYAFETSLLFNRIRSERNQVNSGNLDNTISSLRANAVSTSGNTLSGSSNITVPTTTVNADSFSRWRDRQCYGQRRWFPRDDTIWEKDIGKFLSVYTLEFFREKLAYSKLVS